MTSSLVLLSVNQEDKNLPFDVAATASGSDFVGVSTNNPSVVWEDFPKLILRNSLWVSRQGASMDQGLPFSQFTSPRFRFPQEWCWQRSNKFSWAWGHLVSGFPEHRLKERLAPMSRRARIQEDSFPLHWQNDYPSYLLKGTQQRAMFLSGTQTQHLPNKLLYEGKEDQGTPAFPSNLSLLGFLICL